MPRLFIACPVPDGPGVRQAQEALNALGNKVRTVNPQQLHVTLRFLGDVDEALVDPVKAVLPSAVAKVPAFNAGFARMDALPTPKRPTVAVAMCGPMKTWRALAERIDTALDGIEGLPPRDKKLLPHATLARLKTGRGPQTRKHLTLGPKITAIASPKLNWQVKAVLLVDSRLTPDGPAYTPLMTCRLDKPAAGDG